MILTRVMVRTLRHGQLGLGHCEISVCNPTAITALANAEIKQIACGQHHTLVLLEDGRVCVCVPVCLCVHIYVHVCALGAPTRMHFIPVFCACMCAYVRFYVCLPRYLSMLLHTHKVAYGLA
jgi:hypothetical protein